MFELGQAEGHAVEAATAASAAATGAGHAAAASYAAAGDDAPGHVVRVRRGSKAHDHASSASSATATGAGLAMKQKQSIQQEDMMHRGIRMCSKRQGGLLLRQLGWVIRQ